MTAGALPRYPGFRSITYSILDCHTCTQRTGTSTSTPAPGPSPQSHPILPPAALVPPPPCTARVVPELGTRVFFLCPPSQPGPLARLDPSSRLADSRCHSWSIILPGRARLIYVYISTQGRPAYLSPSLDLLSLVFNHYLNLSQRYSISSASSVSFLFSFSFFFKSYFLGPRFPWL